MTILRRYLAGMSATFLGAWITGLTDSKLPLALGASITVMYTAMLVTQIWKKQGR